MTLGTQASDSAVRQPGQHHVIFVAEEACSLPGLCGAIELHAEGRQLDALVIAPTHDPRKPLWVVEEAEAIAGAQQRLNECVACLHKCGIECEARLADPDPVQAIADALIEFPADEIVMFTRPLKRSSWYHRNELDRVRRKFQQPIEHVVVGEAELAAETARTQIARQPDSLREK